MIRHYILSTLRHLWRRKIYSLITFISLTIGLSVFSLIFLHVKWEFSYNKGFKDSGRIYRIVMPLNPDVGLITTNTSATSRDSLPDTMTENLPDYIGNLVEGMTFVSRQSYAISRGEQEERGVTVSEIDENYSAIFDLKITSGDMESLFSNPYAVALEEEQAKRFFGKEDPVGKNIELTSGPNISVGPEGINRTEGKSGEFTVAAIYRLPLPVTASLQTRVLIMKGGALSEIRNSSSSMTNSNIWLKLQKGASPESVQNQLDAFTEIELQPEVAESPVFPFMPDSSFLLEPIESIYFHGTTGASGDIVRVLSFTVLGILVLMAGCTNAVSLGFAGALERTREVGIRKSVGSTQSDIMLQFLGEPLVLALLSLVPVLLVTGLYHSAVAELMSFRELPGLGISDYALLTAIVTTLGLVIGFYPSLVLSKLRPVQILRPQAKQTKVRTWNLRSVMVAIQFSFALVLLIITSGLYIQLHKTRTQPLGYNPENLVIASAIHSEEAAMSRQALLTRLRQEPGIIDVRVDPLIPNRSALVLALTGDATLSRLSTGDDGISFNSNDVAYGQFGLVGIPLLAGREFDEFRDQKTRFAQPADASGEAREPDPEKVILNRQAAESMGFSDPESAIGQTLFQVHTSGSGGWAVPSVVIGVVENSMYKSIRERSGAEVYTLGLDSSELGAILGGRSSSTFMLRYDANVIDNFQSYLEAFLLENVGSDNFQMEFVEEYLWASLLEERKESTLLLICGAMALLISCIGLYGLVSISMKTRIKEMGVRKVLGASSMSILGTILKSYSWPVLLANIVAWPLACWLILQWIERFPYQLEKFWLIPICILTSLLVLLIAWVTVSALTYKTASAKPVLALRYE